MKLRVVLSILLAVALAAATLLSVGGRVLSANLGVQASSAVLAASAMNPSQLEVVVHLGGQPGPVYAGDGLLLASWDRELSVHAALPASLGRQGYLMLPEAILSIRADAGYAYVLSADERLYVVDLTDPANPSIVDTHTGFSMFADFEFDSAGRLYVSDEQLSIFDVSDPTNWGILGSYPISGSLVLDDTYAYLVGGNTLTILDVSNPVSPQVAGSYTPDPSPFQSLDIVAVDGFVYLQHSYSFGPAGSIYELIALDVSNPGEPVVAGKSESALHPLAVTGDRLLQYVGCPERDCTKSTLELVDISDPNAPDAKAALNVKVYTYSVSDQAFYITGPAGVTVLDFSDGEHLLEAGSYLTPTAVSQIVTDGSRAAIAGSPSDSVFSLDISTPSQPDLLGAYALADEITGLAIDNGMLYSASFHEFDILNAFPMSDPDLLSTMPITHPLSISGFAKAGDYAYILVSEYVSATLSQPGLMVVDVSNPAFPEEIRTIDLDAAYTMVMSTGDRLYLGSYDGLVSILGLDDPQQPVSLGAYNAAVGYRLAGTHGDWFFVVNGEALSLVDASDSASPHVAASWRAPQNIARVKVFDTHLYVGWADGYDQLTGLSVLDIHDPYAPVLFTQYNQYLFEDFELLGPYLLAASGDQGLYVFAQTYSIRGEVRSENGSPFMDAGLSLDGVMTTTSGLDGAYTFSGLIAGDYTLSSSVPGFQTLPQSQTVALPAVQYARQFRVLAGPISKHFMASHEMSMSFFDTQSLESSFLFPDNYNGAPVAMYITPTLASSLSGWAFTGHAFELGAEDPNAIYNIRNAGSHILVEIAYSDVDVASIINESGLVLMTASPDGWVLAGEACAGGPAISVDADANMFQANICNPGAYALFGPTYSVALPLLLRE